MEFIIAQDCDDDDHGFDTKTLAPFRFVSFDEDLVGEGVSWQNFKIEM